MQIQFLNAPDFSIDKSGILRRTGTWLAIADDSDTDISAAARSWAGEIGDPWRQPDAGGNNYTFDDTLQISNIRCRALDSRSCEITFEAVTSSSLPVTIIENSYHFERRKDLSEYKTASFHMTQDAVENIPGIGDVIDWAGENYRCESAEAVLQSDGTCAVTLKAVNTAVEPAGRIHCKSNGQLEQIKTGTWLVLPEALEDFLSVNQLHSPADWAGENFYVSHVDTEPADSALRTRVTLQARYVQLQMIETLRSEEIVCMVNDIPEKLYTWQSVWRARPEDQVVFEAMLGSSAVEWADEMAIVSKVTPRRISDCEYEYTLEARHPETVGNTKYWRDRDLPERKEYYTRVGEMRFSHVQCGYTWRSSGNYYALPNWRAGVQCPIDTNNPLPFNWINQPVKLLEIVEVTYCRGVSSENLESIVPWFTGSRVADTTLAGIKGNFLRYNLDVDDVTDNQERKWTRISKVYRLAPAGYNWNKAYWI